jgi:hypothetical protein
MKYVIVFSNGLFYHDVQSSATFPSIVRFAEIIQNAHKFSNIEDAQWYASQSVKYNNELTFNIIPR